MTRATPKPAPVAPDAADARLAKRIAARLFTLNASGKLRLWSTSQVGIRAIILRELTAARASAPARGTRRGRGGRKV